MSIPRYPFYFIRHGETDWNRQGKIMGHQDIPLNTRGIEQSIKLKGEVHQIEIGSVWSSPLRRARQTAEIITEGLNYDIQFNEDLKERSWGVGEGEIHPGLRPDMISDLENVDKEPSIPQGAESYTEFKNRIIGAMQTILKPNKAPPLIISHGGVCCILSNLLAWESLVAQNCGIYFFNPPNQDNASWVVQNYTK